MKKLIAILGLAGSLSFTPFFSETREQLGIPAKGTGILVEHGFDVKMGVYVRHLDLDNDGIYDVEELYPIVAGEAPMYTLAENPVLIWYDKNKNHVPESDELFNSPNADEDWMTHTQWLEVKKQEEQKAQEQQGSENSVDPSQLFLQ